MSKKAREVMTEGCECVGEKESIRAAAEKLASLNVGSMPICGEDDRLKGMLTDRDIAVKVVAAGKDPESTTAGDLAQGKPVTIGADDSVEEALSVMSEHQVRRLPVIDALQSPEEVTGYREVRYPKQDRVRQSRDAELARPPPPPRRGGGPPPPGPRSPRRPRRSGSRGRGSPTSSLRS